MKNSERFLKAFSEIERFLKDRIPHQRQRPFYQLVELIGSEDPAIRKFEIDLKE